MIMINRLRAWFYRRIQGEPVTPLSVLQGGPWTIDRMEGMRGGFGSPYQPRGGIPFVAPPLPAGIDLDAWRAPFDHDAVQLDADEMRWY